KRTTFDRHTTNYQAWREQMTVCDLLAEYDAAVRPSGRTPYNNSNAYTTDDIKYEWDVEAIRIHDGANGALPNFDIATFRNGTCHSKTNT
ncbi:hypothetical protein TELCIR_19711, partial [Teladorsagia circumcincta]